MQVLNDTVIHNRTVRANDRLLWSRRVINAVMLALGDGLAIAVSVTLASLIVGLVVTPAPTEDVPWFVIATWLVGAWFLQLLPSWGLGAPTELKRITELLLIVFASTVAVLFLTTDTTATDRLVLVVAFVTAWPLLLATRWAVKRLLMFARLWGVPTVVYGGAATGRLLVAALRDNRDYGYIPVGVFDDDPALIGTTVHGVPVLGPGTHVDPRAPIAVLAMPGIGRERTVEMLEGPLSAYRTVVIIPDLFEVESLWVKACDFSGVLGLEVTRNVLDPFARAVKRAFDVTAVVLSAPVWLPVCLLIALAIWLEDRGNPLFLQDRVGEGGRLFKTWKFRTMLPNAEEVLRRTLQENPALRAEWEANYKLRRDPRVTKVGVVLRKLSLDELPQLVNVVLGDMSLVGPRPLPPYHQQQLSSSTQFLRSRVRPGMTGLWQVSGRSEAGNLGMERWDPYYVRNWSVWLDLIILFRTVRVVLLGSGAY
ncbi:exopolysaccharide biosynthesis polyprenyl glycosylphosphotransferase [Deinococcus pimensis]|uniref:exopolysaccharide biosynthesis polyprenyl glycosylphosphotransferase n=1 Tax=Deinococcus pimensis TaxID=309888 RepID=UPI0004B0FB3E|nr:exopolysaccharide biosynthesis polyprenyl glycosylphosphotransferase [Deinococcus pimensis]